MRTFGSLLKAGFEPRNGTFLWRKNEEQPHVEWCRWKDYASNKKNHQREAIIKPYQKKYDPYELYIHQFLPDRPIKCVKIVKPFPFAKFGYTLALNEGFLWLNDNIKFSEEDIYLFPTYFKPIYRI